MVNTGASVAIEGVLVESQGSKQKVELKASKITLVVFLTLFCILVSRMLP